MRAQVATSFIARKSSGDSQTSTEIKSKQTGLTVAVSSGALSMIQGVETMGNAISEVGKSKDGRLQALGAASLGLQGLSAYNALTDTAGKFDPAKAFDITISASLGTNKSQSNSASTSNTARGSTVNASGNVNITATGAGKASNILIQGSSIKAGNNASLTADNQINLLAAKNESSQTSSNSSSSSSIGASYGVMTGSVGFSASASKANGSSAGEDTTYTNTQITAGNTATLKSGGDTTVKGAVVSANQIKADIGQIYGGSLTIESLQDKSTYASSQSSSGGSISFGTSGVTGGSVNAGKTKINSNFESVNEQSGFKAGDGGFQVAVGSNTNLTGGVISSSQAAIDGKVNTFTTGGALSITDVQNSASFSGKASGFSIDLGAKGGGTGITGVGVGLGSDKGNAASTSSGGISGIAGNTAVRTGDAETGLKPIFDADKTQKKIDAEVQIMVSFTKVAPKAAATFLDNQIKDIKVLLEDDTLTPARRAELMQDIKDRSEGGIVRIAVHSAMGALSGGLSGAVGAAASASAAPLLNEFQDSIAQTLQTGGMSPGAARLIASGITGLTAAGVGAALAGPQGAISAGAVDFNNRQLHPTEVQWIKANAIRYAAQKGISVADAEKQLAEQAFRQVQFGAEGGAAAWDVTAQNFLKSAGTQDLPNGGFLFYARADQRADATMYLDSAIRNADFYTKNGLQQPTAAQLQAAAQRNASLVGYIDTATKTAAVASAAISLVGLAPSTLAWALRNPLEAQTVGIITADTAAAIASGAVNPANLAPMLSTNGMKAVTSMSEALSGQAAKATAGGFINATKVCESGCAITGLTSSEQLLAAQIQTGKDTGGQMTEQLISAVAARTGSTLLSGGKYGANNGFDVVFKNADGTVTVIMDGKQALPSGAFSLSTGAGGNTQNSTVWVEAVLRNLDKNSAAYNSVLAASQNNTLVTAVGGVNRTTGQLVVLPVTVPVASIK